MPYSAHIEVAYRLARSGELPAGRVVDVVDEPGGRASVIFAPSECEAVVPAVFNLLCNFQIVTGSWRQRWTEGGRMRVPAEGLGLAVSRIERVPATQLPAGHVVYGVESDGCCVWLVDEDRCTQRLQDEKNVILRRLAGDGLWLQTWLRHRPAYAGVTLRTPAPVSALDGA